MERGKEIPSILIRLVNRSNMGKMGTNTHEVARGNVKGITLGNYQINHQISMNNKQDQRHYLTKQFYWIQEQCLHNGACPLSITTIYLTIDFGIVLALL